LAATLILLADETTFFKCKLIQLSSPQVNALEQEQKEDQEK